MMKKTEDIYNESETTQGHLADSKRGLFLAFVAIVMALVFYIAFPIWIEIQDAGGLESWLNDSEARLAHVLLFFTHLVV